MSFGKQEKPGLGLANAIDGPLGRFFVPADHPETRRVCIGLSRLLWSGEYDHERLPADVASVVDIGGGWGAFAVWARKKWGADLSVKSYEPHARGAAFVGANDPAAEVFVVAVTERPEARIRVGLDWGASSVLPDEGERVPVLHPGKLPATDFLKCDAEGVEPEVLAGYHFWGGLKALAYEWHGEVDRAVCREICEKRGGMVQLCDRVSPWGSSGTAIWLRVTR